MVFTSFSPIKSLRFSFHLFSEKNLCQIIKKTTADTLTVDVVFSSTGIVKDLGINKSSKLAVMMLMVFVLLLFDS